MHKLQTFIRLSWFERWLFVQAVTMLILSTLLLKLFGFRRVYSWVSHLTPLTASPKRSENRTESLLYASNNMMQTATHLMPFHATCLYRSLALWWLLRSYGLATELQIGVRKADSAIEGHAWVEYQGVPVNDSQDVQHQYHSFGQGIQQIVIDKLQIR